MTARRRILSKAAMIVIVGAISPPVCAGDSIPQAIDTARASVYRVVLSLEKRMGEPEKNDFLHAQCLSWKLSKADALTFLSLAEAISPVDLHHSYYSVACGYQGTFTAEGQVYEFFINGGLHGAIRDVRDDKLYLLGCNAKCRELSPFDFYDAADDE